MRSGLVKLICIAGLLLIAPSAQAAEESNYVFNPTLSLTGDCSTSAADPIPDPGCPGGAHPPAGAFASARVTALDQYGNRYVVSPGRVDIFTPDGAFITEVSIDDAQTAAVDPDGNLYVHRREAPATNEGTGLFRYSPTLWKPEEGEIEYTEPPVQISISGNFSDIEVNPVDGHVFLRESSGPLFEFGSAAEGNPQLTTIQPGFDRGLWQGKSVALDIPRNRIYTSSETEGSVGEATVEFFDLRPPHEFLGKIDGSNTPAGKFFSNGFQLSEAVNEENGHVFVGDLGGTKKRVYEFEADGTYLAAMEKTPTFQTITDGQHISFDNSPLSPNHGDLFVPSGQSPPSHAFVYEPKQLPKPPLVETVAVKGITRTAATMTAAINPEGQGTAYRLEYTTQQRFEAEGFTSATVARESSLPPALESVAVSANIGGLVPGTAYRVRATAQSEGGEAEKQAIFATYAPLEATSACPNDALREGPSAALPDCRAYELVSPANTNGHAPTGTGAVGMFFKTSSASPAGGALSFYVVGGPIPGFEGTGGLYGDPYLATRGETEWTSRASGPTGVEAGEIAPGSTSADQEYSFWSTNGNTEGNSLGAGDFIHYPAGHSELIGRGSLGTDPSAQGHLIGEAGSHIVFSSAAQLEPDAPPAGTQTIYDRTSDGATHVVSLLPGDVPLAEGENAYYQGATPSGQAVAFELRSTGGANPTSPIYLRLNGARTYEAAPGASRFAGLSDDGKRLYYLRNGDLYAFDARSEEAIRFTESGDVTVVNAAAGGAAAYFLSPSVLTLEPNPHGDIPQAGANNLYLSREGQIDFLGTVTQRDVNGVGNPRYGGLGLWAAGGMEDALPRRVATDPSRTTSEGDILLFESQADLTGYDPEGHTQVYRYDSGAATLRCLSCPPTETPASGEATLQSFNQGVGSGAEPFSQYGFVENLSVDGSRVFFESTEALVVGDTDGLRDVYEWEAGGKGSCRTAGGCVYLISRGSSGQADYVYAATPSGDDVFFRSSDLLTPSDPDDTPSIYDARVGGGFPPLSRSTECLGESCQPVAIAPERPPLGSAVIEGSGNVHSAPPVRRTCPKDKRKVRRGGKVRCVPARKKHHHKQSGAKRRVHR